MYISSPVPPPLKKTLVNTFHIFRQFYSFCTGFCFHESHLGQKHHYFVPRTKNEHKWSGHKGHTAHGENVQKQRHWGSTMYNTNHSYKLGSRI